MGPENAARPVDGGAPGDRIPKLQLSLLRFGRARFGRATTFHTTQKNYLAERTQFSE
jgi:hypothetical protein